MPSPSVRLYAITTCTYCQAIKKMLTDLGVSHEVVEADLLEGPEREAMLAGLRAVNPACSFPTVVVNDRVIIGFQVQEIKEAIGIRTEVDELHDLLQRIQEPKGFFYNHNRERTFDLLRGLVTNKKRYGYMACPCRLASGRREADKDIICPCVYREADVEEYGACFCQLYVSRQWNEGKVPHVPVPERRPPER